MSHIDWSDAAKIDLREVVRDRQLIAQLMLIAYWELRERPSPDDLDEGVGHMGLLWRRGITRDQRASLDPADLDADAEPRAWDFVIVYRMRNQLEVARHFKKGFVVERILSISQLAGEYIRANPIVPPPRAPLTPA